MNHRQTTQGTRAGVKAFTWTHFSLRDEPAETYPTPMRNT